MPNYSDELIFVHFCYFVVYLKNKIKIYFKNGLSRLYKGCYKRMSNFRYKYINK